jgi:hypothetical protein
MPPIREKKIIGAINILSADRKNIFNRLMNAYAGGDGDTSQDSSAKSSAEPIPTSAARKTWNVMFLKITWSLEPEEAG